MSEKMFDHLVLRNQDLVSTITLNRPEVLNACGAQTHRELQEAFDILEADPATRAIVVIGSGRAFCSGSDLREIGSIQGQEARDYVRLDFVTKNRIAGCSKPTIAAVRGHCVGGGLELALACDVRVASETAKFGLPEITLGSIPGSGGLQRLPPVVGLGIAKEWALSGRTIPAEEAHDRGLVNHIFPDSELEQRAQEFAQTFAERSSTAVRLAKIAMDPTPPADYGMIAAFHALAGEACHADESYGENTKSYVAKGKAKKPERTSSRAAD